MLTIWKKTKRREAIEQQTWLTFAMTFAMTCGLMTGLTINVLAGFAIMGCKRDVPPKKESPVPPTVESVGLETIDSAVAKAINEARQDVLNAPSSSQTWSQLGMVFGAHGFDRQAAKCFSFASTLDPSSQRWAYLAARCTMTTSEQEGMAILERCIDMPGDQLDTPRLVLIDKLLEKHQLDQAEEHLNRSLAKNPLNARARFTKARLLFLREQYQACKDEIIATHLDIKNAYTTSTQQAKALADQGRVADANAMLKLANERVQQSLCRQKTIGLMLASALLRLGEQEASRKQQELANQQPDTDWPDPYTRGIADLKTGLRAMLSRSDLLHGQGEFAQALQICNDAVDQYPDSEFARIRLARSHIRLGKMAHKKNDSPTADEHFQKARTQLDATLKLNPNSVEAYFRLGVLMLYWSGLNQDAGKLSDAEKSFRKAIAIKPDFEMAHFNLAKCLDTQKRLPEAVIAMRDVLRFDPNNRDAQRGLGGLLMKSGKLPEAIIELEKFLEVKPDDKQARKWVQIMKRDLGSQ